MDVKVLNQKITDSYSVYHGDSMEVTQGIPCNSIHYSISSPPFQSLYVYSNSSRDAGNSRTVDDFNAHIQFLIKELFRVIKPGRLVSWHVMNIPATIQNDGYIGIKDFRGDCIRAFQKQGFIFHSEVCVWKDPVIAMQRTKAIGLLHKQLVKDSSISRQGIPDYVITFRKPGTNDEPVSGGLDYFAGENPPSKTGDEIRDSINVWQRYASPVWDDINPSNTLQYQSAKANQDERHICLGKGSQVLTYRDGYKPIEKVNAGDLVLTHKGRWMPVLAVAMTGVNPVVAVRATGTPELMATHTHKLWAKESGAVKNKKQKTKSTKPDWIEAQNLKDNYINLKTAPEEFSDLTEQEWWIVGRWIADGHISKSSGNSRKSFYISCGNSKLGYFLEKAGNFVGSSQDMGSCTQIGLKIKDGALRNTLLQCGNVAINKVIPPGGFRLNRSCSESLLYGYLSGGGRFNVDRNRWSAVSVSKNLLLGIQSLVLRVHGVASTLRMGRDERIMSIEGRQCNSNPEWTLSFQSHGWGYSFADEDGAWKKVKSVEDSGIMETWNLEVAEDNSYTAEGCIVKNCPLQLDLIERCLQLWTNPGDIVLDPFSGIGSSGYVSLKTGRRYIGIELKESYYNASINNLDTIANSTQLSLF